MPKLDRRSLRPCILEPVEKEVENPPPGVQVVHINYGISFNNDYDYSKHLKSVSEFQDTSTFRITGIPENDVLETSDPVQKATVPRRPVPVSCDPRPEKGLMLHSDNETDVEGDAFELEDNFVELAGGQKMKDSESGEEEEDDHDGDQLTRSRGGKKDGLKSLRQEKVMMMERFLYGDNERQEGGGEGTSDGNMEFLDEATRENRNFEKLIQKCRQQRSGHSASQSCITGTSVMSEGLQFALSRDSSTLLQRKPRTDDLEELDVDLKMRTIVFGKEQLEECDEEVSSSSDSDSPIAERLEVMSIQNEGPTCRTFSNRCLLAVPTDGKPRRSRKEPSDLDLEEAASPTPKAGDLTLEITCRRQGESKEEKRLRKATVKQARRERRQVRKANQFAFREEKKHQIKTMIAPIR